MISFVYLILIVTISIDFFINASVIGFLQQKATKINLIKVLGIPVLIVLIVMVLGLLVGYFCNRYFMNNVSWYAATVIFLLAIKLFYNGIRMHSMRLAINPLNKQGMLAITTFIGINVFFIGIAGGLLNLSVINLLFAAILFSMASILGYYVGLQIKKLFAARFEFLAALIYLISAIMLVKS